MIRLKRKYEGRSSLIVMGGPSIIRHGWDLSRIPRDRYVVFLESKALTPGLLASGLKPDCFLMFFPEKCQSNSLQHVMYQSFLAGVDLIPLLKEEHHREYALYRDRFADFFETWRPHRGPHKKFKWRDQVRLKDSPSDLLPGLPDLAIISQTAPEKRCAFAAGLPQEMYFYDGRPVAGDFSLQRYFFPDEENGIVTLNGFGHLNSAAIALFPLLNYMGFRRAYFLGMDMSMLGSMEYASCFTFRGMRHFGKFFTKARRVFSAVFKENRRRFMRPPYEFEDLKTILSFDRMEFVNIYEPYEYALPLPGIRNIGFKEFLHE